MQMRHTGFGGRTQMRHPITRAECRYAWNLAQHHYRNQISLFTKYGHSPKDNLY